MSARRGVAAAAAMIAIAACATPGRQAAVGTPPAAASEDTTASGRVHVVGAAPRMVVALEAGGAQVALIGPLASELATLDGADVTVRGAAGVSPVPIARGGRAITVREYDIDSIAGRKPVVGTLVVNAAGVRLDSIPLSSPPEALRELAGSKVWVVGERDASGALRVDAYGVLRRAGGKSR
ncbi:MAG TPA: hypothetical protein VF041_08790 [Gemmatimonadaceae bacterium]